MTYSAIGSAYAPTLAASTSRSGRAAKSTASASADSNWTNWRRGISCQAPAGSSSFRCHPTRTSAWRGSHGDGTLTVDTSTISGNSTNSASGGSAIINILTATVTNSTISGNMSPKTSGSVLNSDTMTLSYVTMADNSSGIVNTASLTATGTILANSTQGPNCFGNRIQEPFGFNLDSGTSCRLSQPTDLSNTDPLLGPLADNGGPTQTQALQPGSPAIDHGGTSANGCPPTDQRGITRPQGPACDIGAFELVQ
jgi:hypothetical protein